MNLVVVVQQNAGFLSPVEKKKSINYSIIIILKLALVCDTHTKLALTRHLKLNLNLFWMLVYCYMNLLLRDTGSASVPLPSHNHSMIHRQFYFILFLFYFIHFMIPFRKFGPPYLGKATAAARAMPPSPTSACCVFSCFRNPPNSVNGLQDL